MKSNIIIALCVVALFCVGVVLLAMCIVPQAAQVTAADDTPYDWYFMPSEEQGRQPKVCDNVSFLDKYDVIYMGNDEDKKLYLTFDMGFDNGNTLPILDALKKHDAKAAFFVTGHYIESCPDIVKRMVEEGHLVCNHTDGHKDLTKLTDIESLRAELDKLEQKYLELTGEKMPKFLRPPEGRYSERQLAICEELGYTNVFWSFAYKDWLTDDQPSCEEALDKIIKNTHNGMVALLHATSSTNAQIMDELLTRWEELGYEVCPITELK